MGLFDAIVNIFFPTPPGVPSASDILNKAAQALGGSNVHGASPVPHPPPLPPPPPPPGSHGPVATSPSHPIPPPPGVPYNPNDFPSTSGREGSDADVSNALNLIDSLQKPPPQVTQDYVTIVSHVAAFLGVPLPEDLQKSSNKTGARAAWTSHTFPEQNGLFFGVNNVNNNVIIGSGPDSEEKMRNIVNKGRNDIFDVINRVNSFVARAKNAGFVPPENPFSLAMSYNVGRIGFKSINLRQGDATRISSNVLSYIKLLNAEKSGQLNLDRNVNKAAQLSHSSLSLEGFGGTGNTSVDLAKLLPDADAVKEQKAFEALSVFDFTKRVPKVIFTAFYAPSGTPKGVIVGWKKIPDASGYVVKRKNLFDGREARYSLTNDDVKRDTTRLKEYVNAWILSFYDNVQHDYVFTFLDTDVPPHGYFYYTVQAYQLQNEIPGTMFATETVQKTMSAPQRHSLLVSNGLSLQQADASGISPYPAIAHILLGDGKYDWLLAAVNVRQSINRGDSRTVTREYSYLGANYSFLFSQMDAGKFVVPKSIPDVLKSINDAISKYGIMQVLKDVLQETGALYHFEGKDPSDSNLFRNVDSGKGTDSGLISIVAAAIDPETATMNLKSLATNLPLLLSHDTTSIREHLQGGSTGFGKATRKTIAKSGEIDIPQEFDNPDSSRAEDEVQYLSRLGNLGDGDVDLMTAQGVGTFMRTVRIFSDIGPNRGDPLFTTPTMYTADPVTPHVPPPPKTSSVHPVGEPTYAPPPRRANVAPPPTRAQQAATAADAAKERRDAVKEKVDVKVDPTGRGRGKGRNGGDP